MTLKNSIPELYDIQEDNRDQDHPVFHLKYRSHSSGTLESFDNTSPPERLPVIKVLGTGGTIAGKAAAASSTAGYDVDLTIEDLIMSIPDLSQTCELRYEQVFNMDSKDITTRDLLELRSRAQDALDNHDGVVITHGTDTCEETAFFLDAVLDFQDKPVVICGSMRPSTSVSADGPSNLYQACVVAADKQSRGRGVLVTLNDKIGSGYYITKSDANSLDSFKSLGQGYLGNFVNNEVHYYYPSSVPTGRLSFKTSFFEDSLPEVMIFYTHQNFSDQLLKYAVEQLGIAGVIMATMGAGSLPVHTNELLCELSSKYRIPVIYSKRSMDGMVPRGAMPKKDCSFLIAGGYLNPQKSRVLLQLCLNAGMDIKRIRKAFAGVYGG